MLPAGFSHEQSLSITTDLSIDTHERSSFSGRIKAIGAAVLLFSTVTAACSNTISQHETQRSEFASEPAWVQDFSKTSAKSLDTKYWNYAIGNGGPNNPGWGNSEAEYYTSNPGNVEIENGALDITALKQASHGYSYTSARINTYKKFDFEYGKLDVVAKLPKGVGTWPAIWLLPEGAKYLNKSPSTDSLRYLNDGEIDVMEEIGAQPGLVTSSAQSREFNPSNNNERTADHRSSNFYTKFHDFGVQWSPNKVVFTVDGKAYYTVDRKNTSTYLQWPYNQPYYLIINLALGGNYGGIDKTQYPPDGIDDQSLPAQMQIKGISYYPYIGPKNG